MTAAFVPTAEQDAAILMAKRVRDTAGIGLLAGYAGTGKSSTLAWILEALGDSQIVAPTGRAAKRARELTGKPAGTCHSYLYFVGEDADGKLVFAPRPRPGEAPDGVGEIEVPPSRLIICDEASMLGEELFFDLWEAARDLGCGLLLVGDGFQLPPVAFPGETPFSVFAPSFPEALAGQPLLRVSLDKVFRQALESLVLRVATQLRTTPWGRVGPVLRQLPVIDDIVEWTAWTQRRSLDNATVTHRNQTRQAVNRLTRQTLGIDPMGEPVEHEPILVRRNTQKAGVLNGDVYPFGKWLKPPEQDTTDGKRKPPVGAAGVGLTQFGPMNAYVLIDPAELLDMGVQRERYVISNLEARNKASWLRAQYGYALTCHAVQGGQFDEVAIVLERSLRALPVEEDRVRWLYTAVSRAKTAAYVASAPRGI